MQEPAQSALKRAMSKLTCPQVAARTSEPLAGFHVLGHKAISQGRAWGGQSDSGA